MSIKSQKHNTKLLLHKNNQEQIEQNNTGGIDLTSHNDLDKEYNE